MVANRWLSPNECLVLCLIANGSTIDHASLQMNVRPTTARQYARRAYRKLGVHNREEALEAHHYHKPTPNRSCPRGVVGVSSRRIA